MWRFIPLQSGLKVSAVLNVPLSIHPSWLLFGALVGYLAAVEQVPIVTFEQDAPSRWLHALLANALFFGSTVLHEAAHLVVAAGARLPLQRVVLFPFGGIRMRGSAVLPWRVELLVGGAGPLASLVAGVALLVMAPAGVRPLATWAGIFNIALVIFNLLPAVPLDGAAIVKAIGRRYGISAFRLDRFSFRAGDLLGTALVWLGLSLVVIFGAFEGLLLLLIGCLVQVANNVYLVQENPRQQQVLHQTAVLALVAEQPQRRREIRLPAQHSGTLLRGEGPGDGAALPSTVRPELAPWSVPADATLFQVLGRLDRPETPDHLFVVKGNRILGVCARSDLLDFLRVHRRALSSGQ